VLSSACARALIAPSNRLAHLDRSAKKMSAISISDISPGEAVLAREKIQQHRDRLARGQKLEPIHIYPVGERQVVRDGNNRVRAFIEHYRDKNMPMPPITFVPSSAAPPGPQALEGLERLSRYYGVGVDAFLSMPIAGPKEYEAEQTRVARVIWKATE
jgi:hypothetical protein